MTTILLIGLYYLLGLECTFQYYKRSGKIDRPYNEIKAILLDPLTMPLYWGATFASGFTLVAKSWLKRLKAWYRRRLDLYYGRINHYKIKY